MNPIRTLQDLLAAGRDDAVAITAPAAHPLVYAAFRNLVAETGAMLNGCGIGRNDRVAIVLPNGPNAATCFVAIATAASAAPLNPAYTADEFAFYMRDIGAKALIVEAGSTSPAIGVAHELAITVLTLMPAASGVAGLFALSGGTPSQAARPGAGLSDDVALILHTSGTTSRPKIVPLTQGNLAASARNIAVSLELSGADRALNIMPLFHIHGLIAGLLAPLSRGGQIFCTPGFNALKFFAWMEESKPTWYTAVPTMHQAILARADRNKDIIARHPQRFLRSSSASMPPQVISALEATFKTPLIEAYGMTEAAHQMASNPLRGMRKPGAVGLPAGPDIAVMDEHGALLGPEEVGEVVIRGHNVTAGYENNPKANAAAFVHGWFRTGDQGQIKEIIVRGGEKISPREVDEAMLDHPAVAQAVTFAVPHDRLGEDVAAAVVLREGRTATELELRDFLSARLAAFKVPRKVIFVEEIPKGATGKLQRIGLARKLGLA